MQILRALIGGGAELKGAAGAAPVQGTNAESAAQAGPPLRRSVSGAAGMRDGGVAMLSTPTTAGAVPTTPDGVQGIVGDRPSGGDTASGDSPGDTAGPDMDAIPAAFGSAVPLGPILSSGPVVLPGAREIPGAAADAPATPLSENRQTIETGVNLPPGDAMHAPGNLRAETTALAVTAVFADAASRSGASPRNPEPGARVAAADPSTHTAAPGTPSHAATGSPTQPPPRSDGPPPARSMRDAMAGAAGSVGRYASATARRAGTLASTAGRALSERGAALPGWRTIETNLVERGWMTRQARSADDDGASGAIGNAGAGAADPGSVASGNEAAGIVNVVRFAVQAREWLDARRPRAPSDGCPHRRSLRCLRACRTGCRRRGA
ncbi:hypothetical protein [Burkholderia lata]|uniref:hypothetical protein n=1 Tax=Burkholderia lata (strain ATCC 17760 / DSM 23089 / LMG 22485 / NCIMB 9086 / R18194 / 383) TaxID=482957 RepID=UPI001582D992|nr:hypothetical protein [Burkholderia lata]